MNKEGVFIMYNKSVNIIKPLITLFLITIMFIAIGVNAKLSINFLVYAITLLILPMCLKDKNISLTIKIFLAVSVGLISVFIINYLIDKQKVYLYIILFFMAILFSIVYST